MSDGETASRTRTGWWRPMAEGCCGGWLRNKLHSCDVLSSFRGRYQLVISRRFSASLPSQRESLPKIRHKCPTLVLKFYPSARPPPRFPSPHKAPNSTPTSTTSYTAAVLIVAGPNLVSPHAAGAWTRRPHTAAVAPPCHRVRRSHSSCIARGTDRLHCPSLLHPQ